MTIKILKVFFLAVFLSAPFINTAHAQKIVDPSKVPPEFREAAEKRRAEQLKQVACNKAAHEQNIAPRDRPQFIIDCFDRPDTKATDISASGSAPNSAITSEATPK